MKTISLFLALALTIFTRELKAQTAACDCKIENGKNVLVVTGAITLSDKVLLSKIGGKYTYTPQVQIYNKSSCTMKVLGFTIANNVFNPKITILPNGVEQSISKPVIATKAATIVDKGDIKIIKVTVRYTLNGKPCSQVVELLYYDDTIKK